MAVLRVWKDVEDVAAKLQEAGEPVLEDDVPSMWSTALGDEL